MNTSTYDWKDVANSKFDRAVTLALLLALFGIMVTPKVDIKKQTVKQDDIILDVIPPEKRDIIKPPEVSVKPMVDLFISDELSEDDAVDPEKLKEILGSFEDDIFKTTGGGSSSDNEKPFDFEMYEFPPEPINPVTPEYPSIARDVQGMVFLEVDVYKDGTTGNIKVVQSLLSGPGGLDEAAMTAVKKWKFQPGTNNGKPIDTRVIVPIEFSHSN